MIWLGQDHLGDIFSPDLVAHNRMLQHGHPGKVLGDDPWHVTVEWLGLEQEPVSWGVGHNPDPNGTFQFLGLVADTGSRRPPRVGGPTPAERLRG